jgi:hypothetical protein
MRAGVAAAAAAVCAGLLAASPARADWTWNIGYQNPVVSTWGLNLFYIGSQWGFEVGLGYIDAHASDSPGADKTNSSNNSSSNNSSSNGTTNGKTTTTLNAAGDVNGKYFLSGGTVRPYLQAGIGIGLGLSGTSSEVAPLPSHPEGFAAGTGEGYGGIGLLIGSNSFYVYGAYNLNADKNGFLQAGLGFGL